MKKKYKCQISLPKGIVFSYLYADNLVLSRTVLLLEIYINTSINT